MPYIDDWNQKYSNKGLVVVGVHSPEFQFEKNYTNVKDTVKRFGIRYPVILDSDHGTWNAYGNNYWPLCWGVILNFPKKVVYLSYMK
jgi:thiol-disulfide isomerase/thioredoxin